jgi:hypothetical protein
MNKKYDQTDRERDQTGRLEKADADKRLERQDGKRASRGQGPRPSQAGWPEDEDARGGKPGAVRDKSSGENLVDEP